MTFEELGLDSRLVQSVTELGYLNPTQIQEKAIPVLLSGTKDFIGLAQTGTGKTAAFGLPLLHIINSETRFPQALIVCPTRELCMQIVNEIELFTVYSVYLRVSCNPDGKSLQIHSGNFSNGFSCICIFTND